MDHDRRAFVSTLAALVAAAGQTAEGQQRPSASSSPRRSAARVPNVCLFGGLCLTVRARSAAEMSRVLLPKAESTAIGKHVPVMQVPLVPAAFSDAMKKRVKEHEWGQQFDISGLEVLLPGSGGVTDTHRPTVGECPTSISEWSSLEWVASLNKIAGDVRLKETWADVAHAAIRLSGGTLAAFPPGKNTEGVWSWKTSGGQPGEVRQAVTDSVLYTYTRRERRVYFAKLGGTQLSDHWVESLAPFMAFTHVAVDKGKPGGIGHLHLINDLLSKSLGDKIVPEHVGACSRPRAAETAEWFTTGGAGLLNLDMEADAWRRAAIAALFRLYYEIFLDEYKNCPGMMLEI